MPNTDVQNMIEGSNPQFECYGCGDGCGENSDREEVFSYSGEILCLECYEDDYMSCEHCGDVMHNDESCLTPDESYYCEDCRQDTFSWCVSCDNPTWYDYLHDGPDGSMYCEDCYDDCTELPGEFVSNSPNCPNVKVDKSATFDKMPVYRLVGIEAECIFGDMPVDEDGVPMALHHKPTGWREAYDGSISGNGREMISVPTNGDLLRNRILALEDWARLYNVDVNRSCGLHIHFDATDTSWKDLRAIGLVMYKFEQYLFRMLPKSRTNSNWCKKVNMGFKRLVECKSEREFVELWYKEDGMNREKYNDTRYHGLNIHARFYLGTIEFRYHSGTLNYDKISNWIMICNSVMETGLQLSRDDKFEHKEFYETLKTVPEGYDDFQAAVINNQSPNHTLREILDRMVQLDTKVIKYMLTRIKKFNPDDEVFIDHYEGIDMNKIQTEYINL